jgi:hypothetical protein
LACGHLFSQRCRGGPAPFLKKTKKMPNTKCPYAKNLRLREGSTLNKVILRTAYFCFALCCAFLFLIYDKKIMRFRGFLKRPTVLAPQRSSQRSANKITAKKGSSKISKCKGANSLGKFVQRKEPTLRKRSLEKNQIRGTKRTKSCGKKPKVAKELDSHAEKPRLLPIQTRAPAFT